jgi:hypothetical protein
LESVKRKIEEFVSIHDGMFPESESNFVWHEMIDAVHHIEYGGPLRSTWSYFMERVISRIKRYLTKGGIKAEYTALDRYVKHEIINTLKYYDIGNVESLLAGNADVTIQKAAPLQDRVNFYPFYDEFNHFRVGFTDEGFYLAKEEKLNSHSHNAPVVNMNMKHELCSLLSTLYGLVLQRTGGNKREAAMSSKLFRVMDIYFSSSSKEDLDIWMADIYNRFCVDEELEILEEDIDFIKCMLFSTDDEPYFSFTPYSEAYIYGTRFRGRGYECREKEPMKFKDNNFSQYGRQLSMKEQLRSNYVPSNIYNNLSNYWFEKKHFHSWCKFKGKEEDGDEKDFYGQINSFLQLCFPTEPLLNGVIIASVTCRRALKHKFNNYIIGKDKYSLLASIQYVPAINIYSTQILLAGFYSKKGRKITNALANMLWKDKLNATDNEIASIKSAHDILIIMLKDSKPYCLNKNKLNKKYHANEFVKADMHNTTNFTSSVTEIYKWMSFLALIDMCPQRKNIGWEAEKDKLNWYNQVKHNATKCYFQITYDTTLMENDD